MRVILGSDADGENLKNHVKAILRDKEYSVHDVTEVPAADCIESIRKIVEELRQDKKSLGIAFDGYGVGSFIAAAKHQGIIAAEVSDERSAYMTRQHNNSTIITLGSNILGKTLAENIVLEFLTAIYSGGRHQIRVDMLHTMC